MYVVYGHVLSIKYGEHSLTTQEWWLHYHCSVHYNVYLTGESGEALSALALVSQ